jgi:YfiH family protein
MSTLVHGSPRLLRSPLLAARHGFSTRNGGVSTGRYATLNVGAKWGDEGANVDENRRLLAADVAFEPARLATARQVHGATCLVADGRTAADLAPLEADALVTTEPGRAVGVYTADCVPILFSDGAGRVAAAHAGWRGTVAGIGAATVAALVAAGARTSELRAVLGPSIGPCCFEVGDEVAAQFDAIPDAVVRGSGTKPHVDLWRANRHLLVAAGLDPARIDAAPPCTMCDPARFFSFRRDGGRIGQLLSVIVGG